MSIGYDYTHSAVDGSSTRTNGAACTRRNECE